MSLQIYGVVTHVHASEKSGKDVRYSVRLGGNTGAFYSLDNGVPVPEKGMGILAMVSYATTGTREAGNQRSFANCSGWMACRGVQPVL